MDRRGIEGADILLVVLHRKHPALFLVMVQEIATFQKQAHHLFRRESLDPLGAELVIKLVRVGHDLRESRIAKFPRGLAVRNLLGTADCLFQVVEERIHVLEQRDGPRHHHRLGKVRHHGRAVGAIVQTNADPGHLPYGATERLFHNSP